MSKCADSRVHGTGRGMHNDDSTRICQDYKKKSSRSEAGAQQAYAHSGDDTWKHKKKEKIVASGVLFEALKLQCAGCPLVASTEIPTFKS